MQTYPFRLCLAICTWWDGYSKGKDGLKVGYKRIDPQVREMEQQIFRFRKIIADQALEIEFKDELIKKVGAHRQNGRRSL